jgi:hypothetical protein
MVTWRTQDSDLACDVTALGSVYLGGFTVARLARAGRVAELRPSMAARADALFASDRVNHTAEGPWANTGFDRVFPWPHSLVPAWLKMCRESARLARCACCARPCLLTP